MLKIIENERVIFCDVDDTLVMHGHSQVTTAVFVSVLDPVDNCSRIILRINEPMVRLVQEELSRGSQVFIWSRGGYQWAANVADALGLSRLAQDITVLTKPFAYFDDSDVSSWMKDRVYLTPDTVYKK